MTAEVLVPAGMATVELPGIARVFADAAEAARLVQDGNAPAVLWSDGLNTAAEDLAEAVRARGAAVIEVRSERWDGFSASPLSAACRGVISGFGANGLRVAARLLEPKPA